MNSQLIALLKFVTLLPVGFALLVGTSIEALAQPSGLAPDLIVPRVVDGEPAAGKRVRQTDPNYEGTSIYHLLYLPTDWKPDKKYPVIVEYAGNKFRTCTGRVDECSLGYGMSAGQGAIWICMPYVNEKEKRNQLNWWGDVDATLSYCESTVKHICKDFGGDEKNVFVVGFSRGSIGCNYLGLHNDEIAILWRGFVCHSHYDGLIPWRYDGSDQQSALLRLERLGSRPQFISNEKSIEKTKTYLTEHKPNGKFTFVPLMHWGHTDTWVLYDVPERNRLRNWFQQAQFRWEPESSVHGDLGDLVFADRFERSESQEAKDEPGNDWTTSSDKTAAGNKQVDLRDGVLYVFTHAEANHATSVRHEMSFRDGSLAVRFKLENRSDSLKLNFTDLGCKTVHAGHLFDAVINHQSVLLEDRKTGVMNLKTRTARLEGTLSESEKAELAKKKVRATINLSPGTWNELIVHVDGDVMTAELNGDIVSKLRSPGISHPTKTMIRLLVPRKAYIDDIRVWKRD